MDLVVYQATKESSSSKQGENNGKNQKNTSSVPPASTGKVSNCSPSCTKMEDLFVSKAFIAASEDPIVGTSQKGKDFCAKMHSIYSSLVGKQFNQDKKVYETALLHYARSSVKQSVGKNNCEN